MFYPYPKSLGRGFFATHQRSLMGLIALSLLFSMVGVIRIKDIYASQPEWTLSILDGLIDWHSARDGGLNTNMMLPISFCWSMLSITMLKFFWKEQLALRFSSRITFWRMMQSLYMRWFLIFWGLVFGGTILISAAVLETTSFVQHELLSHGIGISVLAYATVFVLKGLFLYSIGQIAWILWLWVRHPLMTSSAIFTILFLETRVIAPPLLMINGACFSGEMMIKGHLLVPLLVVGFWSILGLGLTFIQFENWEFLERMS